MPDERRSGGVSAAAAAGCYGRIRAWKRSRGRGRSRWNAEYASARRTDSRRQGRVAAAGVPAATSARGWRDECRRSLARGKTRLWRRRSRVPRLCVGGRIFGARTGALARTLGRPQSTNRNEGLLGADRRLRHKRAAARAASEGLGRPPGEPGGARRRARCMRATEEPVAQRIPQTRLRG